MHVHAKVTYVFYQPQDYDEMKLFEENEDLSRYRKAEDTIATRYTAIVDATYPYKPSEEVRKYIDTADTPQTDCG